MPSRQIEGLGKYRIVASSIFTMLCKPPFIFRTFSSFQTETPLNNNLILQSLKPLPSSVYSVNTNLTPLDITYRKSHTPVLL